MELYLYAILIVSVNFVVNIKTKCLNYFIFQSSLEKKVKKFLSFGLLTRAALYPATAGIYSPTPYLRIKINCLSIMVWFL